MPYKNMAVELPEKLLKDDIKARTGRNIVQEKKYSDCLQGTLRKNTTEASDRPSIPLRTT